MRAIFDYVWERNPRAAELLYARIEAKVALLADWPGMGHHGYDQGTREFFAHPNYRIVYRERAQEVIVLRVKHVARQQP